MKRSMDRILTSHVGSLPRPPELREMEAAGKAGSPEYEAVLQSAVNDLVKQQLANGVDVINDGEIYKPSWSGYIRGRLKGFEERPRPEANKNWNNRGREAEEFAGYFADRSTGGGGIGGGGLGVPLGPQARAQLAAGATAPVGGGWPRPSEDTILTVVSPLEYIGGEAIARDVARAKTATQAAGVSPENVFMAAVGPDNIDYQPGANSYYASEEEYVAGAAKALKAEYKAITDAGFTLQIDTPVMKYNALMLSLEEFRRRFNKLADILNDTLADIPQEQIRLHICFGGGRGPHTGDIMLGQFMDIVLRIKSAGISLDQNVRHEHEWNIWKDLKLPEGKVLIPGVVSHTTDTIEHPELVAERLVRYASLVGRENVWAGTDCGLGGRVHPDIVWAKFRAMAEGARIATKELWVR